VFSLKTGAIDSKKQTIFSAASISSTVTPRHPFRNSLPTPITNLSTTQKLRASQDEVNYTAMRPKFDNDSSEKRVTTIQLSQEMLCSLPPQVETVRQSQKTIEGAN
jgi:hypothetical protein